MVDADPHAGVQKRREQPRQIACLAMKLNMPVAPAKTLEQRWPRVGRQIGQIPPLQIQTDANRTSPSERIQVAIIDGGLDYHHRPQAIGVTRDRIEHVGVVSTEETGLGQQAALQPAGIEVGDELIDGRRVIGRIAARRDERAP